MKRRNRTILAATLIVVGIVAASPKNCRSTALPPRLGADQQALVTATHFHATVGVQRAGISQSESLIRNLRATNLFDRVDDLNKFTSDPDLMAKIVDTASGTATIPCFTAVSLGIIPTIVDEEHGYSFAFWRPRYQEHWLVVPFKYHGRSTLGWWAAVLNRSPDYTADQVDNYPRFRDGIAWAVVSKRKEIEALLKR